MQRDKDNRFGIYIPRYNEPRCTRVLCCNDDPLSMIFIDDETEKWKVVEVNRAVVDGDCNMRKIDAYEMTFPFWHKTYAYSTCVI